MEKIGIWKLMVQRHHISESQMKAQDLSPILLAKSREPIIPAPPLCDQVVWQRKVSGASALIAGGAEAQTLSKSRTVQSGALPVVDETDLL